LLFLDAFVANMVEFFIICGSPVEKHRSRLNSLQNAQTKM
jgi:hypothetical protein